MGERLDIGIDDHPLSCPALLLGHYPRPLAEVRSPAELIDLLALDAAAPLSRSEEVRKAGRDLLRHGGYRPTGRGKPAAEYLVRAAGEGALAPINAAVDVCNAVSLHSGLSISVVDLDRAREPFRIAIAGPGSRYIFNASGQEIDLGGLLCLADAEGPCANAVKDCQRTKTGPDTRRTLTVLWGHRDHAPRVREAADWYERLLRLTGAECERLPGERV